MDKKMLSRIILTLFVMSALTVNLAQMSEITENPEGWMYGSYNLAGTRYYPYPSKYHIPDKPFELLWSSQLEEKIWGRGIARTGDVNGDGKLEVVQASGNYLKVISSNGDILWTENIPGKSALGVNMLEDVTGDGIPEIFVSIRDALNTNIYNIYVYDGHQNRIKTLSGTVGYDGYMEATAVFDGDNDGDMEILCLLGSGYSANPRGARLYDYDTGTMLWYYAAGNPIGFCMVDLNNDGVLEITTSGWFTVHNNAFGRGKEGLDTYTYDGSVFVVVINENGDEILTKEIHGEHNHGYAYAKIVDLDRDGTKEILVVHSHEPTRPGTSEIYLWDSSGNELHKFTASENQRLGHSVTADINKDGKDEVIFTSWTTDASILRVLDYDLNLIDSEPGYGQAFANDINGDGEIELITRGTPQTGGFIAVLDKNLNELWRVPYDGQIMFSDLTGDGVNEIIVAEDQAGGGFVRVLSFPSFEATIDIDPDTLNLKSNGEWISVYVELPADYDVANIDVASILLTVDGGDFYVDPSAPTAIGDYDFDGISDLMVKFNRVAIRDHLTEPDFEIDEGKFYNVSVYITGSVDTITFLSSDIIKVRMP